jgi:hypothetical protein
MFRRHKMDLVFLSRTDFGEDSKNEIVYVLRFNSSEELQTRWASMPADPEWKAAAARSEEDGPLVSRIRRRLLTTAEFPEIDIGTS